MIKRVLKNSESVMAYTNPANNCTVVNKKEVCGLITRNCNFPDLQRGEAGESHTHNCIVTAPPLCLCIGDRGRRDKQFIQENSSVSML